MEITDKAIRKLIFLHGGEWRTQWGGSICLNGLHRYLLSETPNETAKFKWTKYSDGSATLCTVNGIRTFSDYIDVEDVKKFNKAVKPQEEINCKIKTKEGIKLFRIEKQKLEELFGMDFIGFKYN